MTAQLKPDEVGQLTEILDTAIDKALEEFEQRINGKLDEKGVKLKVDFAEQASVNAAKLLLQMSKNYAPERRLQRLVDSSNKVIPKLTKVFSEATLIKLMPDSIKTQKAADLCQKAGAISLAQLLGKSVKPSA